MAIEINRAHHITLTYSGHGKFTATWQGFDQNTIRRTIHEDTNWHDVDGAALQAANLFVQWINGCVADMDRSYRHVLTGVTVSHIKTDKNAVAVQTDTIAKEEAA